MVLEMPVMDGNTAAKKIKELRPDLPIIAQSAYESEFEKANYITNFDDYLTKPIDGQELKQKLLKFLEI